MIELPSYCERVSFGEEPINTLSNVSFWIAAYLGWRQHRLRTTFVKVACALSLAVGLFSGLWHWFHVAPLLPLDSVPLYALVLVVAFRALALLVSPRFAASVLVMAVTLAVAAHVASRGTVLNAPSRHGVILIVLAATLVPLRSRAGRAWPWLATGLALYASALAAKSIDLALCSSVPIGVHWIWHLLGGIAAAVSVHGVYVLERRTAGAWLR